MKKTAWRILCLALACLLMLGTLIGCSSSKKTLMTLGKQEISVHIYELLLSRMKGTLDYNGYPVSEDSFWNQIISSQGATYDDYFCINIRDEAKKMLAKLYMFEEVYDLTLPQKYYDEIDEFISDVIELSFDGSKSAFNAELAAYGVNVDMLRENYVMEDKIDHLISHISSLTGDAAREEYYNENYVCFRQILFPMYEYLYVTDENGDLVYYQEGTGKVYYDISEGAPRKGTDGKNIVDDNGDTVYFKEDGRISYNTKKGVLMGEDKDKDGYTDYRELDAEEKQIITDRVQVLSELITSGDFSLFEEYGEQWSTDEIWNDYPNGIFINLNKTYEVNYIDDLQSKLVDMDVGETAVVQSENAYHFVMKYDLTPQAYADKANADWFSTFEDEMISEMLDNMCEQYLDQIEVDVDVLASAKTMKTIGANTEY